jgi:hypothetical protein
MSAGDGPVLGDDDLGLVGLDGAAVGVADDIGHAAVEHSPGALGEVGGHDAVLVAGMISRPDQGGAQQRGTGFGHGLALAVGVAVSETRETRPVKARNCLPRRNRPGLPMQATRAGAPTVAKPGRLRASAPASTHR